MGLCMDGLLSVPPFLPPGVQSQRSSVLAPMDSCAQRRVQRRNGTCYFWEGTSCSGGDQPSRVRAWPRGSEFRVLGSRVGSRGSTSGLQLSIPPIAAKAVQRFEPGGDGSCGRSAPRQRFLLLEVVDKKVDGGPGAGWEKELMSLTLTSDFQLQLLTYNWAPDLGAALGRALVRLVQWQNSRAHLIFCLLSQKLGLFHHCGQLDFPVRDEKVPVPWAPSSSSDS